MNNYTEITTINQDNLNTNNEGVLILPSFLTGFNNTQTKVYERKDGQLIYVFLGDIKIEDEDIICAKCGCKMHKHDKHEVMLKHYRMGNAFTYIRPTIYQFQCDKCGANKTQTIPFKDEEYQMTKAFRTYIESLLALNKFTQKSIGELTGVSRTTIAKIDYKRLKDKYVVDGKLIKPETQAKYLSIDEFKLHENYKFATHIINLETGEILWIEAGKKKQVVYDFIEHVGLEWMEGVIAVACDMNSDFEEAFIEKCPHIEIVYDYFHIVKNFNEKVVDNIRKDLQRELIKSGKEKEAKSLKGSRYILNSNEETLKKKDLEAKEEKVINKGSEIFKEPEVKRTGGNMERYRKLLDSFEILLVVELIREFLKMAYAKDTTREEMESIIFDIMELCEYNGNERLLWFKNFLYNHLEGILSHAKYHISSSKIEGTNNKIKTTRRQAFGYPNDEYFFLKCLDLSRIN